VVGLIRPLHPEFHLELEGLLCLVVALVEVRKSEQARRRLQLHLVIR